MELSGATASQLLDAMASGETTAVNVVRAHLDAISSRDKSVEALISVAADAALEKAAEVDRKRAAGEQPGPLAGLPVVVKDNICTQGTRTTCASRMLENFIPPYDAHIVERLNTADAVIIGKANLDEFAMGSSTENSALQITRNPWNLECAPGGSSGGSAAAVAASLAPLSVGSDTGGSIRQPASFCGVVGMKPTYGRVSRYGLVAFASSLDQIGPFANDVTGAALLLETLAGHDSRDSTSVDCPVPAYSNSVDQPLDGLRVGVVQEYLGDGTDDDVRSAIEAAIDVYRSQGADIVDVSLPHTKYAVATYYLIACSEASSNLARYDGIHYGHRAEQFENMVDLYAASRAEGFGDEVKRRIMLGVYALSEGYSDQYYVKALKVRRLIRNDFDAAFKDVDVIVGPTCPTPAFQIGELVDDPLQMYLSDICTISANLAGIPGISVPAGISSSGLPVGLQLLAGPFEEGRLLRAARMFERETDWHTRRPSLSH
ncbi:MAG: Asp-tRNA(Asn)/Glu-tRNA(Gln) amidotransferase subunit GatA [Planctomycetota bacterium]|jgi:aspartyl-tRNA(Asn)/glutamyl-tRNA(Gln) amidotransferase subunit A